MATELGPSFERVHKETSEKRLIGNLCNPDISWPQREILYLELADKNKLDK